MNNIQFYKIKNDYVFAIDQNHKFEIKSLAQYWRLFYVVNNQRFPISTENTLQEAIQACKNYIANNQ